MLLLNHLDESAAHGTSLDHLDAVDDVVETASPKRR